MYPSNSSSTDDMYSLSGYNQLYNNLFRIISKLYYIPITRENFRFDEFIFHHSPDNVLYPRTDQTITKESCNCMVFISVNASVALGHIKAPGTSLDRICNHQSIACPSYNLYIM